MKEKEKIKVTDAKGFHYEVDIEYFPRLGFSNALYNSKIIGQVELNKIYQPTDDDERNWEAYEESFSEWRDEMKINLDRICKYYFDLELEIK